eukprot:g8800.t1
MCLLWAALLIPSLHAELPDPGGVFAGTFRSAIAPLTFAALANGFLQVPDSVRARLDKLERVELCVFLAADQIAPCNKVKVLSCWRQNDETPNWKCGAASIDHDSASVTASSPRQSSGLLILASTPDHSFPQNVFLVCACPRSPVVDNIQAILYMTS